MGMGFLIFLPLWALNLRQRPSKSLAEFKGIIVDLFSVATYQSLTHAAGVIALGAGAVSFTQVVKASEPAFTAAISGVFFNDYLSWQSYASLIPVMVGVAMSSATELSFSWYCLAAGIMSNVFAAARGVFGKKQMSGSASKTLSPENYYAVLTIISFMLLLPIMLLFEGSKIIGLSIVDEKIKTGIKNAVISGILFYLYNEVSFKALSNLNAVSHALANTVKRIVIIISSVIIFSEPLTAIGKAGATLAIAGVFFYSIVQIYFKPIKKSE